ncbi:hypothetical protein [Streptomyces sp. WMMB 322]|uniref:hypothetical protein n=1 Tax=Streptomyces sp. WMMB 322 TaxID=1286821 RepID=UPI0006E3E19B|nr:hypothetical protein [Streptomyces sp. WMMB 322]
MAVYHAASQAEDASARLQARLVAPRAVRRTRPHRLLGECPEQTEKAGNLGVLDFDLGALACPVLTGVAIWPALRCALPTERVEEILCRQDASVDAPEAH